MRACGLAMELAQLIRDVDQRRDLFIVVPIAGIGLATTNLGIAFGDDAGTERLIKWARIGI